MISKRVEYMEYMEFLMEYVNQTDNQNDIETIDNVYKLFKTWFKENFTEICSSKSDFIAHLIGRGFTIEKRNIHGIKLIDDVKD